MKLGSFYKTENNHSTEKAIEKLCLDLGFSYSSGAFPFFHLKQSPNKIEILCLYPDLLINTSAFLGKNILGALNSHEVFKVTNLECSKVEEKKIRVLKTPLFEDYLDVTIPYKTISLSTELIKDLKTGEDTVVYLMTHPETTFAVYKLTESLYYQLGFPLKKFDNLGAFWKGIYGDLREASFRKIA